MAISSFHPESRKAGRLLHDVAARPQMTAALLWMMSVASGAAVANLYYNQPMLATMARTFHADPHSIGLVATFTQAGYALGMPLFVPLGDFMERRRLVVMLFMAVACALAAAALAQSLSWLVLASFFIGLTTLTAQIMIPLATELSLPQQQGRTIGSLMSGILLGVLLARTLSGAVAAHWGWRSMFWIASGMALLFSALLAWRLPHVPPHHDLTYPQLIRSIFKLALETPKLRQVSLTAAMIFASFSAFWTTLVFLLERPPYYYGSQAAGLFGLIGASGALAAPLAGRYSDRRGPRFVVAIAIATVFASYLAFWGIGMHLLGLVAGVVLLDAGVQAAQVANQSRVLSMKPEARNRVNTIYMICYFGGGSLGSLAAAWAWSRWQWNGVCGAGISFIVLAGVIFKLPVQDLPTQDPPTQAGV